MEKRFYVRELVEKSNERVSHVKYGVSFADALHAKHQKKKKRKKKKKNDNEEEDDERTPLLPPMPQRTTTGNTRVYLYDRRKAVPIMADTVLTLTTHQQTTQEQETAVTKEKLGMAAIVRGHQAFLKHAKKAQDLPAWSRIKDSHQAFQEFQKTRHRGLSTKAPAPIDDHANNRRRIPIRYGDRVCLLAAASEVPLAIGPDGRSTQAPKQSTHPIVAGPHMMFTLVDFRDLTRRDEITVADDFWLQVDASYLQLHRENDEDVVSSFLTDTYYYLGCPGSHDHRLETPPKTRKINKMANYKVLAMKASVPSRELYGDDDATRSYAVETNGIITHLAKWRFRKAPTCKTMANSISLPSLSAATDALAKQIDSDILLNCDSIVLVLNEFMLDYDEELQYSVLRGPEDHNKLIKMSNPKLCWHVRLLQRPMGHDGPLHRPKGKSSKATNEWLRQHQKRLEQQQEQIQRKALVVAKARREYDQVAARSNRKVAALDQYKQTHELEYFGQRYHQVSEHAQAALFPLPPLV